MTARILLIEKNKREINSFVIKTLALPKEYSPILAAAAKHNTYVETISNKADALHLKVKRDYLETLPLEYFNYIKHFIRKQRLGIVDLIADVTEEDFYGKVQGLHIIPWTGKEGWKGNSTTWLSASYSATKYPHFTPHFCT